MFSKVDISEGFITDILQEYASQVGVGLDVVRRGVEEKVCERVELLSFSPLLYKNMMENAVEAVVFDEYMPRHEDRLFSEGVFYNLKNMVIEENPDFFPLKDGYSKRRILKVNWFVVPTSPAVKLPQKMQECQSAMVTNRGDFVFNRDFCESLCRYAKYKGVVPKGDKYISNGGDIPDYYGYIEFLIMHEFLHIIHGDVFYAKKFRNINKDIQNIVGDFVINYKLVRGGYAQPPIGIFGENINYNKQETIEEMRDIVIQEFLKMPEGQGSGDRRLGSLDEHDLEDVSDAECEDGSENLDSAVNENQKRTENLNPGKRNPKEGNDDMSVSEMELKRDSQRERTGIGQIETNDSYTPQYRWSQLIKRLLPTNSPREDYSYSKMSKKTVSCLKQLKEVGVSSAKPGLLKSENEKKGIFFIVDNSGSVIKELEAVNKEIISMLRGSSRSLLDVYILKFDSSSRLYRLDVKKNTYQEISDVEKFSKGVSVLNRKVIKGINKVFEDGSWGGSTNLRSDIINSALRMWSDEYNIVLFSDTDVIYDKNNYENLTKLIKETSRRRNSLAIITTRGSYRDYKKLGLNKTLLSSF